MGISRTQAPIYFVNHSDNGSKRDFYSVTHKLVIIFLFFTFMILQFFTAYSVVLELRIVTN